MATAGRVVFDRGSRLERISIHLMEELGPWRVGSLHAHFAHPTVLSLQVRILHAEPEDVRGLILYIYRARIALLEDTAAVLGFVDAAVRLT
eukprot:7241731-Alexandrium_andersonii.AAC.1